MQISTKSIPKALLQSASCGHQTACAPITASIRTTLIILCSIENHHKKLIHFSTLFLLWYCFRAATVFFGLNFSIHFEFSWEISFVELAKEGKNRNARKKSGLERGAFVFHVSILWSIFVIAAHSSDSNPMKTI